MYISKTVSMNFFWLFAVLLLLYFENINAQEVVHEVELGTNVNLQCRPSSNAPESPTTYEWYDPQNQFKGSNIHLIIQNFSHRNQGLYTCKASQIINGRIVSSQKSIFVRVKGQTGGSRIVHQVIVPSDHQTFMTGVIFLLCKIQGENTGPFKYEWTSPSGETKEGTTLFKNHVGPQDGGRYTCRVTNMADGTISEGHTIVTIYSVPMTIEKISGTLAQGEVATLRCDINRNRTESKIYTKFEYSWEDPMGRRIGSGQNIDIRLDSPSAFGIYICKISTNAVNPPYSQTSQIEIKSIPHERLVTVYTGGFTTIPKDVRYFQSLEMICTVNPPLPNAQYEILHNDKFLTSSNIYRIDSLGKQHHGIYTCNIKGSDLRSGQFVNLRSIFSITPHFEQGSKIELKRPPGPQLFVRRGDKRELHCEISPNSGLRGSDVVWYFNNLPLTQDETVRYGIEILPKLYVSIMVLPNIKESNEGKYECKVRGEVKEAYILVMRKPKEIEVSPSEKRRKVSDSKPVEFHCKIDGYETKNKDIIWTFISKETGQETALDSRWTRSDDDTADQTSFIVNQDVQLRDSGTYKCTEPRTRDSAVGILHVEDDVRIIVTPQIIKLRAGQTASFQCYMQNVGRSGEYPEFFIKNGGRATDSERTTVERLESGKVQLTYRGVTVHDNGTRFTCRQGRSSTDALLLVEPVCTAGFRLCRNSQCINAAKFCDGKADCDDKSDEDPMFCSTVFSKDFGFILKTGQCDPLSKPCEVHNGQAPTSSIYQVHWSCDGEDDCGNGFDESRCYGSVLECGGLLHRCSDGTKSIPKAFLCDKDKDCANGDDENKCVPPTIIPEPSSSYVVNARRGDTVVLTCQATGFPLPRIVWRFNWGCLTDERKMIVSDSYRNCGSTVSTLTISNFLPGDDGIYNCEALSNTQRAWSKDYQLLMNFRN